MPGDDANVAGLKVDPAQINSTQVDLARIDLSRVDPDCGRCPIDSETALYAVIGNPVGHSLSPLMHNAAFLKSRLNAIYVAFRVTDIHSAISGLRSLGFAGVSVTIPHKTAVLDLLDAVDPEAAAIGAVNTIVKRKRKLVGFNTDGAGAVRALSAKITLSEKRTVVIGAGGAARAIGYAVTAAGGCVTIVNRSQKNGEALAKDLGADFRFLSDFNGTSCDVLINTTPVGMLPRTDAIPVDEAFLHPDMVVMDIVYNPLETRLLRAAARIGCTTVSGLDMFVYQGAAQFELWTKIPAPVERMRSAVLKALSSINDTREG